MKALIAMFSLVFIGSAAQAGQNVFTYRTVLVGQSKEGRFCPQIVRTTAVNEVSSLRGRAVHITDQAGFGDVFTYEFTTRTCREDVVCISENHYRQKDSPVTLSMNVNNNGTYPTTDLPGYSSLKLSWVDQNTSTAKSCSYMFF